jgi:hypothetical protein
MNNDFFFSKKGQRQLSQFVGQELIYDYFVGSLDDGRKKAVEDFLRQNPDANKDFQKIRNGIEYADQLGLIKVSEPLFDKISAPASIIQVVIQKIRFAEWHPALRGAFEAAIIATGVSMVAIFVPWHKVMEIKLADQDFILTEVSRNETRPRGAEQEVANKDQEVFSDESQAVTTTTAVPIVEPTVPQVAVAVAISTPTTQASAGTTAPVEKAEKAEEPVGDVKLAGFLFRGSLHLVNPQVVAPKLAEKITELGGRKAGEVELGWMRGTGAYFHFTIPEEKYSELETILKDYGEYKIQKERHGRIMPKGIIRLIITAEDKK